MTRAILLRDAEPLQLHEPSYIERLETENAALKDTVLKVRAMHNEAIEIARLALRACGGSLRHGTTTYMLGDDDTIWIKRRTTV